MLTACSCTRYKVAYPIKNKAAKEECRKGGVKNQRPKERQFQGSNFHKTRIWCGKVGLQNTLLISNLIKI